jgi:hypothetical protein
MDLSRIYATNRAIYRSDDDFIYLRTSATRDARCVFIYAMSAR